MGSDIFDEMLTGIMDFLEMDPQARAEARFAPFLLAAKKADIAVMQAYSAMHKNSGHFEDDASRIIHKLIDDPHDFTSPLEVVSFLERQHISFENALASYPGVLDLELWSMYARNPSSATARAAAVLLAEEMRLRVLREDETICDLPIIADYLQACGEIIGAKNHMDASFARDSIIATQNALVDYVAQEGPDLPLNRGAAMLSLMESEVGADVSRLWARKITDVKEVGKYSVKDGDYKVMEPVFSAP
ncbi:MAG: hypothetical protein WC989_03780 [Micavibrio sp.]